MKIACCQWDIAWEDKAANYAKVQSLLARTPLPRASLVVLPEMFATGFSMNAAVAEEGDGPSKTEVFLQQLARENGVFALGGLARASAGRSPHNQAVVFSPEGQLIARYNKMRLFTLGGEGEHYVPGTEIAGFDWQGCQVAPFICYDLRFPELFRGAVRRGAQLFVVIANWPTKRVGHWATLLQARAIENQAYVVGVNRCGNDPKHTYPGRSMIVDPHGAILAELGPEEGLISADVDLAALETWRKDFPALQDVRKFV